MFCANCGKEIADGTSFCGYCGNAVAQPQTAEPNSNGIEAKKNKKPLAKKTKNIIKAAVAMTAIGALLAAALYMTVGGGAEQVALEAQGKEKITVNVTGIDIGDENLGPVLRLKRVDDNDEEVDSVYHLMTSSSETFIVPKGKYHVQLLTTPISLNGELCTFGAGSETRISDNVRSVDFSLSVESDKDFSIDQANTCLRNIAEVTYSVENGEWKAYAENDGVLSDEPYRKAINLLSRNSKMKDYMDAHPQAYDASNRDRLAEYVLASGRESENQNESN